MPRILCQRPGLLIEDIRTIAFREPENYRRWCITADYAMDHADRSGPVMVSRTHREEHNSEELVFALLVFNRCRDMPWELPHVLFGEIGLSPALYEELVRDVGVRRPLPQEAIIPDEYSVSPSDEDDAAWSALLTEASIRRPHDDWLGDQNEPF